MHTVNQAAEKFHMAGMHTFYTDTVYNTSGERSWVPGTCHRIYIQMQSNRRPKYKFKSTFGKPSIIFTDNGKKN